MQLKIRETIKKYIRVLKVTKRPTKDDFWTTVRVTLIGIAIIGLIGFIFYLISVYILPLIHVGGL
jgi:protein transport protein SEC61 subunit gamma-like protein